MEQELSVAGGFATQDTTVAGSAEPETSSLVDRRTGFVEADPGKSEADNQLSKAPPRSTAPRWPNIRRCGGRTARAQEREELKKQRKMRIDKFDDFVEWVDGDASLRYHPKDSDARKHLSGWAMRNTNNHNKKVLKKSCLGVYVCNRSCRGTNGDIVTVRPATSDRARRKQADKKCPRPGCDGKLYHVACSGKNGYPVTHFWRVTDSVIIFQSKGRHDHPRPDVVKTPSVAKMALFEYHRNHKHERPKDICKRMGVHIHKSFSRVDRVARQLREVQTALSKEDTGADKKEEKYPSRHHGYSLRNSLTRMWSSQTLGGVDTHQETRTGVTIPAGGIRHHSLSSSYQDQAQYDGWGCSYVPQQHALQAEYQHSYMTGYPAQLPSEYYHNSMYASGYQIPSSGSLVYDSSSMNYESYDASLPPKSDATQIHKMTELTVVRESPRQLTSPLGGSPRFTPFKYNPAVQHGQDQGHPDGTMISPLGRNSLKRSLPPALHHIDTKHPKLDQPSGLIEPSTPLKLANQTPPINIDMSSFSDIFDISASLGEEGLAGRPKTPVFHAPSPPVHDSPQKPTGAALQSNEPPVSPASSIESVTSPQTALSVSVASSPSTVHDSTNDPEPILTSPSSFKYHQLIHHSPGGPVLTQLSTHSHQASSNTTEDENGTYIDFLVSMYLKDSEKPISTLKNELHVYTERNNQKNLAFRAEQGLQFTPHLKSPTSSQFDFSWYDMDRRSQHFRNPSSSQTNLLSPLNSTGQLDYSAPYLKDVIPIEQVSDPSRVLFLRNMNAPSNPVALNRHVY